MGWRSAVLVLLAVQAASLFLQPPAAAGDWLAPFPFVAPKNVCYWVDCGKGRCREDFNRTFGYVCECDAGWTKVAGGGGGDDHFLPFRPCVIPNCTLDYSCNNATASPAPPPPPLPPPDRTLYDPCFWSHCGEGTCARTSTFGYRCDCRAGHANLLNVTSFPCIRACKHMQHRDEIRYAFLLARWRWLILSPAGVLGSDCARVGIVLPETGSPAASPTGRHSGGAEARSPGSLMWAALLMMLTVAVTQMTD